MNFTRIIALAIIAGAAGTAAVQAQTLRNPSPPAEFPPAAYEGRQYVDSRGCIYIRAGIDSNVTWVPRVTRSRKQLCGYKPTEVAGTTRRPAQTAPAPEVITLEPEQQPQSAAAPAAEPAPAPAAPAPAPAKPRPIPPQVEAAAPKPAPVQAKPRPVQAAAPKPARAPAAQVPAAEGGCPGISEISQRYTNKTGVRCGPQAAPPAPVGPGSGIGPQSGLALPPDTRVLQKHIYQDRRLSNTFDVPKGYRPVWKDGRLNPNRAERTPRPAALASRSAVPRGYVPVQRDDDRLNPMRGVRSPEGDAQMAQIWTNEVPRTLVKLPLDRRAVRLPQEAVRSPAEATAPMVLRLSTRSAPEAAAPQPRRYVRAATFAAEAQARAAAEALAAHGLPVRLGFVTRGSQPHHVVLAGPFTGPGSAGAALERVKSAGFKRARLSK